MSNDQDSQFNKAYDYAMFLLNIRLRTEGEIASKLQIKNYKFQIIQEVIAGLKAQRYLDDLRYAEVYLENLKKYKNWGYYGIKKKFMEKKLSSIIIEQVLTEGLSEEEELAIAKKLFTKLNSLPLRGRDKGGVMTREDKSRLAQKLKARGFRGNIISKLIFA
ncbi:MAG: RecX family transcriptional regulator [Patescibacteria group bacterium]